MNCKSFLVFIACIICCHISAQSLYYFEYEFQNEEHETEYYNAFVVLYENDTGFIRVNFINRSDGVKYVVDMNMIASFGVNNETGEDDTTTLYFDGIDPIVVSGDTSAVFDPSTFVFKWNADSGYYAPFEVVSLMDDGNEAVGDFTAYTFLEAEDLTEDFVLEFFSKDDDFYKDLFETTTRQLTVSEKATTLHLIIVANTNDPDIGTTCALDKDRTLKNFSNLAEFMGIKLDAKTIFGDNYSKKSVEDAVQGLKPSSGDIVVFYYSGHGYSKPDNYQYPYIELRSKSFQSLDENSINVEDIYKAIKQKGPRLSLVISDCCNSAPEVSATISGDVAMTRSSSLGWSLNNCYQLFLPPKPTAILIAAAAKGELSAGNNSYGGFFTYNFSTSLVNSLSPLQNFTGISWNQLIAEAQAQTVKKASNTLCNRSNGTRARCVQHPVFVMQ